MGLRRARKRMRDGARAALMPFYKAHHIRFADADLVFPLQDDYARQWFGRYRFRTYNWHEPSLTQFMLDLPHDMSVFVDIGAHLGYFSAVFSRLAGRTSHAIELDPANFTQLTWMVQHMRGVKGRIEPVNLGLSHTAFTADMPIAAPSPFSSLRAADVDQTGTRSVPVITLDGFCAAGDIVPDVVKIDVEGHEWAVLDGGADTFRTHRPVLILEVHVPELAEQAISVDDLIDRISGFGYQVFWFSDHRSAQPGQLTPFTTAGQLQNFDLVALPST